MAKPASRSDLINYCKRQLGAPVLEINVADEQIDDLVDDAIQIFHERHFDGVTKDYVKYKITQDDIDRWRGLTDTEVSGITTTTVTQNVGLTTEFKFYENSNYLPLPPDIIGVEKIFHFESKIRNDSSDGLGISTQVRVQSFADHTLRMKFEGSQLYHTINDTLDFPVGPVVSKLLLGYLEDTVLVQLKRGHVKSFFVGLKEPNAVTNIKRSFLSQIAFDVTESSHIVRKTPHTGTIVELLRNDAISARLPLPSKTRKETSLLLINHMDYLIHSKKF